MRRDIWAMMVAVVMMATPCHADSFNPDLSGFPHWRYILKHEHFTPPATPFNGDLKPVLDKLHAKYLKIPYKTDMQIYGEWNHWATRAETHKHGAADCKGIAEAEMFDLLEMGVPDQDVEIIVAYVLKTGELHAVTRARNWVLDNRASRVLTMKEFGRYYIPIFGINRIGWHLMDRNQLLASGE